jgi:outer membrane protein assembly complex protein YaeT
MRHVRAKHPAVALLVLGGLAVWASGPALNATWWNPWKEKTPEQEPLQRGEHVKVRFEGAAALSERKLRGAIDEQLSRIRSEGLSRPNADDAAYYTAVFYHQNGYANAEVEWKLSPHLLVLKIREGKLIELGSTTLSGNSSISSARLLSLLTSVTSTRLQLPESQSPFVEDELQMGANRIKELYVSEGFLDANLDPLEFEQSADSSKANATLVIHEGKQYQFGSLRFRGDLVYGEAKLRTALQSLLEHPYSSARCLALQNLIEKLYTEKGHFDAQVEVTADPSTANADAQIPVVISVQAGPVYKFDGVDSHGTVRLRGDWFEKRLAVLKGQTYSPSLLERKQQDLLSTGLFQSLEITPVPQPDGNLSLRVEAQEAPARQVGLSLGYGTYEGAMAGVRLSTLNLAGRGLPASVEINASQRALALETSLSNPWLFETRTEFVTRAFIRQRIELGYDKREVGGRVELSRRILTPLRVATFGQLRTVEITSADIPSGEIGPASYQIGSIGVSLSWDKRDSALNPSRGWIASILTDTNTLDNGATFGRTSGRLAWHYPMPGDIRFATSARFGVITFKDTIPIDERYFLGGANTVRSFKEKEMGAPGNNAYPTGGSGYSLLNAETDFPLLKKLRGALFFDTGSLSTFGSQIPTTNYRSAVGLGVRYELPVGPVRLDVGVNPNRRTEEQWGAVHLSFGMAF